MQKNENRFLFQRIVHQITNNLIYFVSFCGICVLILLCLFNHWFLPYPSLIISEYLPKLPPAWYASGDVRFFLGTDENNQDIFSTLLKELKPLLIMTTMITFSVAFFALILSFLSIFSSKFILFIKTISNTLFIIPSILLAIALCLLLGKSDFVICFAIGLALLPRFLSNFIHAIEQENQKEYIELAKLDGISTLQTIWFYLLPNLSSFFLLELYSTFSYALLEFTTLNFLAIGDIISQAHWGVLMKKYINLLATNPFAFFSTGLILMLIILIVRFFINALISAIENKS